MSSDPRTNADSDHRKPTRRTLLSALGVLPAAGGAALAMATPASAAAPADVPVALARAGSPAPSALRELHRRWSEIEDELRLVYWQTRGRYDATLRPIRVQGARGILRSAEEIDAEIDERLAGAGTRRRTAALERARTRLKGELEESCTARREREEQLGITELKHRRAALEGEAATMLDAIKDAIKRKPASSIEDIAVLLDIALREDRLLGAASFSSWFAEELPWLARLIRALHTAVPDIQFAAIKRSIPDDSPISYGQHFAWTCGERPEASGDSPEIAAAV